MFWEVGFAESLGKPIVFLVEQDQLEAQRSPVLVSATLQRTYNGKIFNEGVPKQAILKEFQNQLFPFLATAVEIVKGQVKKQPEYVVHSGRQAAGLAGMIAEANQSIDLITSNLSYFADIHRFFVRENDQILFPFDIPVHKGVKVRILCLDPDSPIAAYRAKQLSRSHDVAGYREELRSSAAFFYQRYHKHKNVDVRIYDDLPLQITMLVDDKVVTSIMSRGNQSRDNIHLYFNLEFKGVHASFERHFAEVLANQAQTIHIANLAWARVSVEPPPPDSGSE